MSYPTGSGGGNATSIQGVPVLSTPPGTFQVIAYNGSEYQPATTNDTLDTVAISQGGTGATDASAARTALGVAIGSDVQAHNGLLDAVANLNSNGYVKRAGASAASTTATIPATDIAAGTAGINISGTAAGLSATLAIGSGGTGGTSAAVGAVVATATGVLVSTGSAFAVAPLGGKQVSPSAMFASTSTTGRNGSGAVTWTGVKVGDVVLVAAPIAGSDFPASPVLFESTITVNDQIQQASGADASGITFAFLALRQS